MASDYDIIHAIRLADAGRCTEAILMLQTFTQQAPDDFRPWWALAHLCTDPADRRAALERVLAIKPDQHEAHEIMAELNRRKAL
jgi:hypothetical protein